MARQMTATRHPREYLDTVLKPDASDSLFPQGTSGEREPAKNSAKMRPARIGNLFGIFDLEF